jgi:phosphatidylserine decarboxylase
MNTSPDQKKKVESLQVFDRQLGGMVDEKVLGDRFLRLAYWRPANLLLDRLFLRHGWFSRLMGRYADSRRSRHRIARVVEQLGIDPAEFAQPPASFATFNDFFIRHLHANARPFDPAPEVLCSPADCRLLAVAQGNEATEIKVKGLPLSLEELLAPPDMGICTRLRGGPVIVCRLSPADYHRFHYPVAGRHLADWSVPGRYDSVHPVALRRRPNVLTRNVRHISLLDLSAFGMCAFVEVGAFGVARIVHTHDQADFRKMDEKGYFAFGGSTIVMAFQPGVVELDRDLLEQSGRGTECRVRAGERIGTCHPGG